VNQAHCATCVEELALFYQQEQQRVAVGPGNAHCMSTRQCRCGAARAGIVVWGPAAATGATAAIKQFGN